MAMYRVIGAIGALIGLNLSVKILNLPLEENFILGNHLGEAIMIIGIIGLLADLNLLQKYKDNFFVLGFIALIAGTVWEVLSFSSLFIQTNLIQITTEWFKIAPIVIFTIGVPCLYISKQVSREKLIFGFDSTNSKGLIFNFIFCAGYTIIAMYILLKLGLLVI